MYGMDYDYGAASTALGTSFAALGGMMIFSGAVAVFMVVCLWKIFTKANQDGWKAIVPVYNLYILVTQISGLSIGMFILCFVPIVQIYPLIKSIIELNKKFGKGIEGAILMLLFPYVMYPILAFGKATYNSNLSDSDINANNVNNVANTINANNTVNTSNVVTNENGLNNGVVNEVNAGVGTSVAAPELSSDNLNAPGMNTNNESGFNVTPNNFSGSVTPNNFSGNVGNSLPANNNENVNQPALENQAPSVMPVETPVEDNPTSVVNTQSVEAPVSNEPVNTEATKFCPQCGTKVNASDAMCFMCGHKF